MISRHSLPGIILTILAYFCFAGTTHLAVAQRQAKEDQNLCDGQLASQLKQKLDQIAESSGFTGTVLVGSQGKVILAHAIGSSYNQDNAPLHSTSLFEVASCTKSFAGVAAVLLQQQGKLDLNASISEYLPNVPDHCTGIKVRHLLDHTSGIPGNTYGPKTDSADATIAALLGKAPARAPGTRFEYWNGGYALISEIIAQASGKSFAQFCKDELFQPTGMNSTMFNGDTPDAGVIVSTGVARNGDNRSALSHPYSDQYDFSYRAMGGMVTNAWDLWRFTRSLKDRSLLNEESIVAMTTANQSKYGLGWYIEGEADELCWWHSGGVRGFTAAFRYFPATDSCIVVLCNNDDARMLWPIFNTCDQAVKGKLLGPVPATLLAKIAGSFSATRGQLKIPSEGTNPPVTFHWGGPVTRGVLGTVRDGSLIFFDGRDQIPLEFKYGDDGKAIGCTMMSFELTRD